MAGENSGGFWSGRRPDRADCRHMINAQQRIRLVTEFQRTGSIGMSALKSGMDRKTARKYLKHPERLGEPRPARDWRTRVDPLAAIWQEAFPPRLRVAPELDRQTSRRGKTIAFDGRPEGGGQRASPVSLSIRRLRF